MVMEHESQGPLVIEATGLLTISSVQAMKEVPGNHILFRKKAVVLSTAHIIRKML